MAKLPSKKAAKLYMELRRMGATPTKADNFLKRHKKKFKL